LAGLEAVLSGRAGDRRLRRVVLVAERPMLVARARDPRLAHAAPPGRFSARPCVGGCGSSIGKASSCALLSCAGPADGGVAGWPRGASGFGVLACDGGAAGGVSSASFF